MPLKTTPLKVSATYPTPYEYALMSQAIYDDLEKDIAPQKNQTAYKKLVDRKWSFEMRVSQEDYVAGIFVHVERKQAVIAHRGSQNTTSWITDLESVVQNKPGHFIDLAIKMLNHKTILNFRADGYRLSTTGHSLGGFLAQICTYWSHRADFPESYYPAMSAMTFDSPGAVEMMHQLEPNLVSQQGKVEIDKLNIQNFCAMPTLVSTFGTHTGTLWHLSGAEETSSGFFKTEKMFLSNHKMAHILKGLDTETEIPRDFRQMADWPQANYDDYSSFRSAVESILVGTVQLIPSLFNKLYKQFIKKTPQNNTWFDQLFIKNGQVELYLEQARQESLRPTIEDIDAQISLAITAHYTSFSSELSSLNIPLDHFDPDVQEFLVSLDIAQKYHLNHLTWDAELFEHYGEDLSELVSDLTFHRQGNKINLILPPAQGNFFAFREALVVLLKEQGILRLSDFIAEKTLEFSGDMNALKTLTLALQELIEGLKHENSNLKEKIVHLEQQLADLKQHLETGMKKNERANFEFGNAKAEGEHPVSEKILTKDQASREYVIDILKATKDDPRNISLNNAIATGNYPRAISMVEGTNYDPHSNIFQPENNSNKSTSNSSNLSNQKRPASPN